MEDNKEIIRTMIDAIHQKDGSIALDAFNAVVSNIAADALETKTREVAATMFTKSEE